METLLGMCVQGSFMILAVFLARVILGRWFSPRILPLLWGIVLVRLFVPFSAVSPSFDRIYMDSVTHVVDADVLGQTVFSSVVPFEVLTASGHGKIVSLPDWLFVVWITGTFILLGLFAALYVKGIMRFARAPLTRDDRFLDWVRRSGTKRKLSVKESEFVHSPLTYGLIRPVIVVPLGYAYTRSWREVELALEHELTHVRSFDVLYKAALVCSVCLYWFNPLVWAMHIYANRDLEVCRDEQALKGCSRSERVQYATLLMNSCVQRVPMPAVSGFALSAVECRVASIVRNRVPGTVVAVACMLAIGAPLGSLAVASTIAPVSVGHPVMMTVDNGIYAFEVPQRWLDDVSVRAEGTTTWVYLTEYPDVWLLKFELVDEMRRDCGENHQGCALLYECEVDCGIYLQMRGINYLNLSVADAWRTAYIANPEYPGKTGEELAVALCTGDAFDAAAVHAMNADSADIMVGFDYYIETVIPTIEVHRGSLLAES